MKNLECKMKIKLISLIATLLLMANSLVFAGGLVVTPPGIDVGNSTAPNTASPGGTAVLTLDFYGTDQVSNFNFRFFYDDAVFDESQFDAGTVACTPFEGLLALTCSVDQTANTISGIGVSTFPPSVLAATANPAFTAPGFGTVTLPVRSDAPFGDSALAIDSTGTAFFNLAGANLGVDNSLDGLLTIEGPTFAGDPVPGDGLSMGGQIGTTVNNSVQITNIGAGGTTLNGACVETLDNDTKFTVDETPFAVDEGTVGATVVVSCDSSVIGGPFTGEMQCSHDGDNAEGQTATYALTCNISAGPQPNYEAVVSNAAMVAAEQGDASPTGSLTITNNTGEALSTLTGAGTGCTYSGDTEITVTSQGDFSVPQGGTAHVVSWSCNTAVESDPLYSGTLSCAHNGINVESPQDYNLTCDVGPPGPAVYSSVPGTGATIEMTPGGDVLVGSTPPTSDLVITNDSAEADDRDLVLLDCGLADGTGAISASAVSTPLAMGASTTVTFTCATDTADSYSDTYSCAYDEDGDGVDDGPATYTVNCGVRDPESSVTEAPGAPADLSIFIQPGGFGETSVTFSEQNDEDAGDSTLDDCSLSDDTFFTITSPNSFPVDIPSGGSVEVVVEASDPSPDTSATTDLDCTYTDTSGSTDVTYTINLTVQPTEIPTLSEWSRIVLILSLLVMGGIVVRRRVTG
jgi:hypothetical protein